MTTKTVISRNEQGEIVKTQVELTPSEIDARAAEALTQAADKEVQDVLAARNSARRSVEIQLEYIAENGFQAWLEREYQIRLNNPKPGQSTPNMDDPSS